jgi:hypothetical protein
LVTEKNRGELFLGRDTCRTRFTINKKNNRDDMEFKKYTLRNSTEIFIKADDKLRVGCEVYTKLGDGEMSLLQEPTNFVVNITLRVVDGKVSSITS